MRGAGDVEWVQHYASVDARKLLEPGVAGHGFRLDILLYTVLSRSFLSLKHMAIRAASEVSSSSCTVEATVKTRRKFLQPLRNLATV